MADSTPRTGDRIVVLNPESGSGDHEPKIEMLADEHGFEVLVSGEPGEAVALAERAAPSASIVAAAGGDGTVNEVVRGIIRADALEETTFGVVPAGTGNNFAEKIGVESIAQSFDVLTGGETRRIDLGLASRPADRAASGTGEATEDGDSTEADEATRDAHVSGSVERTGADETTGGTLADGRRPFVNSCVCGITAEASASTSSDQKGRLGTLAYVINTFQEAQEFDGIPLYVETGDRGRSGGTAAAASATGSEPEPSHGTTWSGEAVAVLVGNGRRFPAEGTAQANMEDGLFEVTIIEDRPALNLVGDEARRRLMDAEADHITRLLTSSLSLSVRRSEPTQFSLDGEMVEATRLDLAVEPRCLSLRVGEGYRPDPDR